MICQCTGCGDPHQIQDRIFSAKVDQESELSSLLFNGRDGPSFESPRLHQQRQLFDLFCVHIKPAIRRGRIWWKGKFSFHTMMKRHSWSHWFFVSYSLSIFSYRFVVFSVKMLCDLWLFKLDWSFQGHHSQPGGWTHGTSPHRLRSLLEIHFWHLLKNRKWTNINTLNHRDITSEGTELI